MPFLSSDQKKPSAGQTGARSPAATAALPFHEPILVPRDVAPEGPGQGRKALPFHLSLLCRGRLTPEKIEALASTHKRGKSNYDLASHWIRTGRLSERLYFLAAAQRLGLPYLEETEMAALHDVSPDQPLDTLDTINCRFMKPSRDASSLALLPESYLVCAPQGKALDLLEAKLTEKPALRQRVRLTSPSLFLSTRRDHLSDRALRTHVYRLRRERGRSSRPIDHPVPDISSFSLWALAWCWLAASGQPRWPFCSICSVS